jgi:signal transduction histidine kinase
MKGQKRQADSSFREALRIARLKGSDDGEAMSLSGLASIAFRQKDFAGALERQRNALGIWERLGNPASQAEGLNFLSEIYFSTGRLRESIRTADSALAIAVDIDSKKQVRDAYGHLADAYAGLRDHARAFECLGNYVRYQDSLQDEDMNERIAEMQTRFDTERKEAENRILQQENRIKDLQLSRSATIRWILIGALLAGWVIAYLLYARYRQKQQQRMQETLLREREQRTRAVLEAEEHERARIARELHDGVGQLLAAARLNISQLEKAGGSGAVQTGLQLLDETAREVRSLSHAMMPTALATQGLVEAVRGFVGKVAVGGLRGDVSVTGMDERLDPSL